MPPEDSHFKKRNLVLVYCSVWFLLSGRISKSWGSRLKLFSKKRRKKQYGRRFCLTGILSQKNESAEDVRYSVKPIIKESGCDVTEVVLDCTHRVGKNDSFRKNVRLVIAKFTAFRHGTIFYQAGGLSKTARVHLDITKERFALCHKASDFVKSKESVMYVFVDGNCWLKNQNWK